MSSGVNNSRPLSPVESSGNDDSKAGDSRIGAPSVSQEAPPLPAIIQQNHQNVQNYQAQIPPIDNFGSRVSRLSNQVAPISDDLNQIDLNEIARRVGSITGGHHVEANLRSEIDPFGDSGVNDFLLGLFLESRHGEALRLQNRDLEQALRDTHYSFTQPADTGNISRSDRMYVSDEVLKNEMESLVQNEKGVEEVARYILGLVRENQERAFNFVALELLSQIYTNKAPGRPIAKKLEDIWDILVLASDSVFEELGDKPNFYVEEAFDRAQSKPKELPPKSEAKE